MKELQKLVGSLNKSGALSGFLGGVAGGGLTSLATSKKGKKVGKKALKYGALAAVGGLAWKAYQQYSQKSETAQPGQVHREYPPQSAQDTHSANSSGRTFDYTPARMPEQAFTEVVDDHNESGQLLLMRAMIAAAYADGHIDEAERQKIFASVENMALTVTEKAMLFDELRKPMTLSELVNTVPDAKTGIEVYAASVTAIDLQQAASTHYLEALANQLCIPRELVASIHNQLEHK
ncbi:tellurite resistance TerB family protein [Pseudoalteromonas sp. T1lg10]|uniref:tellurite resistance TerB family protein n=1 Tax=Pseudoalteromonas sp. T1lg10 TaxID=2077093 RepID=UPI000CF5E513|nr:tellurite resistance TerB family protein [Pseudoalteromonas sp. T1lg10]